MPTTRKIALTMKYVETAKTSHMRGERKLTQRCLWLGYGNSQ